MLLVLEALRDVQKFVLQLQKRVYNVRIELSAPSLPDHIGHLFMR